MDWQEIAVIFILVIALLYLVKRYTKKDDCDNGNCSC